jgi:hypothetical protein
MVIEILSCIAAMHSQLLFLFPLCNHMFTLMHVERYDCQSSKDIKGQASPLSLV